MEKCEWVQGVKVQGRHDGEKSIFWKTLFPSQVLRVESASPFGSTVTLKTDQNGTFPFDAMLDKEEVEELLNECLRRDAQREAQEVSHPGV